MRRALLVLALWAVPHLAWGAIVFDAAGEAALGFSVSLPLSFTVGAGADRVLLVMAMNDQSDATTFPTGCTYNSIVMSSHTAFTASISHEAQFFYLVLGTSASPTTANIQCNYTNGNSKIALVAASYSGVSQTTPILTPTNSQGTSSNPATWTIASTTGNLVVVLWFSATVGVTTPVPVAGETIRVSASSGAVSRYVMDEPGAPSVTSSATMQFADDWYGPAVNLVATGAAPPGGAATRSRLLLGVGQ